ncbi:MAG: fibrobacter succinogenes major paralogous domain-containing protein [Bacteroidales bacterium]|nr:fibrobacter succinogenes major paralogous domain-containing protein [Bacteroidales bacterium]
MKRILVAGILICLFLGSGLINSCKKDPTLPTLTTNNATNVTINSMTSGGKITNSGGADVTARGVCWSTSRNPVVTGSHTSDNKGSGEFTSSITGLSDNTLYYIRAYATNKVGTAYGNEVSVTTSEIVIPTLATTAISAISFTTATSGGNISTDGGAAVTARGVCWSTSVNPTIELTTKTSDGTGSGAFSSDLTGLLPETTYYVRAYATNSIGTAYGTELTFTTSTVVAPTLTTVAASSITLVSAISGGTITSYGGAEITAKGVCWSTSADPTTALTTKTSDGTGSENFTSSITGLAPGVTYHVRSYATNSIGTSYGNDITFTTTPVSLATVTTTAVSAISFITATSGGAITNDGGGNITEKGVVWSTTADPTVELATKTSNGTGTATFTSNITGLLPGTVYHVRAYATNSAGTAYGEDLTFTTTAVAEPVLTTAAITSIAQTTAISGGNITSDGGANITEKGVVWSTTTNPTIALTTKTSNGTGTGGYVSNITGLLPGTQYHVRAFATNSVGTAYGNEVIFTTAVVALPTLTTTIVTAITQTTASSGGVISSNGGGSITEKGVVWSTTANPTVLLTTKTSDGTGNTTYTSSITGLLPGTLYHVRSYATNSAGTGYGTDLTFTTGAILVPTLTTTTVSGITLTAAASGGVISSDGGGSISEKGVVWSTSANPTVALATKTTNGTGTATFTSSITGLAAGTTYYLRSYATNTTGTGYGNQIIFRRNVADIDGNTYKTVTIGNQLWMAENLKTTLLNDNTPIPEITDNTIWSATSTLAYCWMNNNEATYKPLYGALYNWFAINTGTLCPTGWHIPSDAEFGVLEVTLGISPADVNLLGWRGTDQGSQMKSATGWNAGENGTNTSGFSALPGGYRFALDGSFQALDSFTYWWASDYGDPVTTWYRRLDGNRTDVHRGATNKEGGKYARCLKN